MHLVGFIIRVENSCLRPPSLCELFNISRQLYCRYVTDLHNNTITLVRIRSEIHKRTGCYIVENKGTYLFWCGPDLTFFPECKFFDNRKACKITPLLIIFTIIIIIITV
jgi:hypothetical protein